MSNLIKNKKREPFTNEKSKSGLKVPIFFLLLTLYSGSSDISRFFSTPVEIELKFLLIIPTIYTTLLCISAGPRSNKRKIDPILLTLFLLLIFILLISSFWVQANEFTIPHLLDIAWIFLLSFLSYTLAVRVNEEEIIFSSKLIVAVGSIFMLAGFLSSSVGEVRFSAFGGGPNVYVRIVLMAFLFSFFLYIKERKNIYLVLMPALFIAALLSGSRGGIVALALTILFTIFIHLNQMKRLWSLLAISIFTLGAFSLFLYINPSMRIWVQSRFFDTLFGEEIYTSGRDSLFMLGLEVFQNNPLFGIGVSGYASIIGGGYPHNLFIEVAAATGLLGLTCLFLLLLYAVWAFLRKWKHNDAALFFFLGFIFIVGTSQFSGSFFDTRFAWFFLFFAFGIIGQNQFKELNKMREE